MEKKDVDFNSTTKEYLSIAEEIGFKIVGDFPFEGSTESSQTPYKERMILLHHPSHFLLRVETFAGDRVNSAKLYFGGEFIDHRTHRLLPISGTGGSKGVWSVDVRAVLSQMIEALLPALILSPKWERKATMFWLVAYSEWSIAKQDRLEAETTRYQALPKEIQEMIGDYPYK